MSTSNAFTREVGLVRVLDAMEMVIEHVDLSADDLDALKQAKAKLEKSLATLYGSDEDRRRSA